MTKKTLISENKSPFIIAELSGNHNGSIEQAMNIIKAAAEAGVNAVKLQTYTADTMTLNCQKDDFMIKDDKSLWNNRNLYELYEEAHTPWEWHKQLFNYAAELGIICFSSPFDETAVDFLEELGVDIYKVASFEITHLPLIKKVARTGKPVILSTGMATENEISDAIECIRENNGGEIILLKCTSAYPAPASEINLLTIPDMKKKFGVLTGLSDHTLGTEIAVAATALGACVIEKHFTLCRDDGGVDSVFSLEPHELKRLVKEIKNVHSALGTPSYTPSNSEKSSLAFRQSIYVTKDIKKGEIFTTDNIRIIRPGYGLPPKLFSTILGKVSSIDLKFGEALQKKHIEGV